MLILNNAIPVLPISISEDEIVFLNKIWMLIEQQASKTEFDVSQLALLVELSRVQLNRKVKKMTSLSVGELIMYYRMEMAKSLLKQQDIPIKEVAWKCGFTYQANFCRSFSLFFEKSPTNYRAEEVDSRVHSLDWKIPLCEEGYKYLLNLACRYEWLTGLLREVIKNMSNSILSIKQLADASCLSTCSLNRKIKSLFKVTPQKFVRDLRLQYASELITAKWGTVAEIAYNTGFYDPAHFCRCFKNVFGCRPSVYKDSIPKTSMKWLEDNLMYQNDK